MKIFQTQFQLGKLTEKVSGNLLTNSNVKFKRTDKGLGIDLNGSSSKLTLGGGVDSFSGTQAHTFCSNIRLTGSVGADWIIDWGTNSYGTSLCLSGRNLSFYYNGGNNVLYSGFFLDIGKDYSLCVTYDGTNTVEFFVNGVSVYSGSITYSQSAGAITGYIGARKGIMHFFQGIIYDANVYDKKLSNNEMSEYYKEFIARKPLSIEKRNFYYPKPTRLNEDGLVAAYNMIPSAGGVLTDISGNGNNATINGPLSTVDGMLFDGGRGQYINTNYRPTPATEDFSVLMIVKGTDFYYTVSQARVNSPYSSSWIIGTSSPFNDIFWFNSETLGDLNLIKDGKYHTLAMVWDHTTKTYEGYVDGVSIGISGVVTNTETSGNIYIGSNGVGATNPINKVEIKDTFKIYKNKLTEQQVKYYHNKRASQVSLSEDFRYEKADGTNQLPIGWTPGTMTSKIVENGGLDGISKYLNTTSTGIKSFPQTQAYGTWEFNYRRNNTNQDLFMFVGSQSSTYNTAGMNGYMINILNTTVYFYKVTNGAAANLLTATSQIVVGTWHKIKITRSTTGEFKFYKKTATTNYAQFGTAVTDNTHTTSKVATIQEFGSNTDYANFTIKKGIKI